MYNLSTPYYKALDITLVFCACALAYWLRFSTFSLPLYYFLPTIIFSVIAPFSLTITKLYQANNSDFSIKSLRAAFFGLTSAAIITAACLYLTKTGEDYSRLWLGASVILAASAILFSRYLLSVVFHISMGPRVVVLLGQGETAKKVADKLHTTPPQSAPLVLAAHFNIADACEDDATSTLQDVASYIENYRADASVKAAITEIWITHDIFSRYSHGTLENAFCDTSARLVYIPELPNIDLSEVADVEIVSGVPTINSGLSKEQKFSHLIKLLEDQLIAWIAIVLLMPLFLLIGILIKIDSQGPVFYRQSRYGFGGKSFRIWKFRSMKHSETNNHFEQASKNDSRVTRIGAFLRKSSLDELPQLFNVINGTMSIVGPRPHPTKLNEYYRSSIKSYMFRHAFKPGITGLAQIRGYRGETNEPHAMQKRIESDLEYITNWNLLLDIKILTLTTFHLFTTDKAY